METKKIRLIAGTLFLLVASACTPVFGTDIGELTVAWEDGLKPPYLMLNEENKPIGIAVDMVNKIFSRKGIQVKHTILPWIRCLYELENGNVDIVPNASYKKKRTEFALYSLPLYATHLVLFYSKERFTTAPQLSTLDEMKKYTLGGVLGFNYSFYNGDLKIDTAAHNRTLLMNKLKHGRFDIAIAQREVILMMAKNGEIDITRLGYVPDPVKPIKAYHVLVGKIHPQAQKLLAIVDEGIEAIEIDGTKAKIFQEYLGLDK